MTGSEGKGHMRVVYVIDVELVYATPKASFSRKNNHIDLGLYLWV